MKITDLRIDQEVLIKPVAFGFKTGQIGKILVIDASHETHHITLLIDDGGQAPFESSGFTLDQIEEIKEAN